MKQNNGYDIASSMDSILKDPEHQSMFSSSAILEKLAFKRVADEDQPTEIEVELSAELMGTEPLEATAAKAKKCVCGKKIGGICKCAKTCKDGVCKTDCACECKTKKAGVEMSDMLIKSAFDSLMSASSDLEEAGFEHLSANALILMNHLIVEAKKKKMTKEERMAAKEKADAAKMKMKEKAEKMKEKERMEKDKNMARDKKMKDQAAREKAKAKMDAEKEKEKAAKKKKQEMEKSKK